MKIIRFNPGTIVIVIAILCTGVLGIASADSGLIGGIGKSGADGDTGLHFRDTINIDGKVWSGDGTKYAPASAFPVAVYLEVYPLNNQDPGTMPKVKLYTTLQPDSNGHFSFYFVNMEPDDLSYNYVVLTPVVVDMNKVELVRKESDPDVFVENSGTPYAIFDLSAIRKKGNPTVNSNLEWRITPITIANPLPKEGVQAHSEPEINSAVSLGTKVWNCTTITEPGYYTLEEDINAKPSARDYSACIIIDSPNVHFNGNNKKIQGGGNNMGDATGIVVYKNNVTIENVDISEFDRDIEFFNTENGILQGSHIHDTGYDLYPLMYYESLGRRGIGLYETTNTQIIKNIIDHNSVGIAIFSSRDNTIGGLPPCQFSSQNGSGPYDLNNFVSENNFYGNSLNQNHIGIYLSSALDQHIIGNTFSENGVSSSHFTKGISYPDPVWHAHPSGILFESSNNNEIKINAFHQTVGDAIFFSNSSNNKILVNNIQYSANNGFNLAFKSNSNLIHSNVFWMNPEILDVKYEEGVSNKQDPNKPWSSAYHIGSDLYLEHDSENNRIFNNHFYQGLDREQNYPPPATLFNVPGNTFLEMSGPNIIGGPYIGGNYWTHSASKLDSNHDGFADKAICLFEEQWCDDPQPDGPNIDHNPLVGSDKGVQLSHTLTGDLCQNPPPDATWKFSNQNLNNVQNPAGSITLSPTQPGNIKNIVQEQLPNRSVVSLGDQEPIIQPEQPTSLLTWLVSIPRTIMSFVQKAPGPEKNTTGPVTSVDIQQKPVDDDKDESMHIVVLPGSDDQRIEPNRDTGNSVPIITLTLQEQPIHYTQVYMNESQEGSDATPSQKPRISVTDTYIDNQPRTAPLTISCPAGSALCQAGCVDIMTDTLNCGSCDKACSSGYLCLLGECQPKCSGNETFCNGACVNLLTDPADCGTCGNVCTNGGTCGNGQCVLPMVKTQPTGPGGVVTIRQHL